MGKLAINGGSRIIDQPLQQPWPMYDKRDEQAILEVMRSRKWGRSSFNYFNHPRNYTIDLNPGRLPQAE